mmetsp:Transcript_29649/g.76628  ORF Transcript_29649/g.76628 Transcript_29649/m.76628 type:complete len:259 (-) Transcript_29649:312-1088(-)
MPRTAGSTLPAWRKRRRSRQQAGWRSCPSSALTTTRPRQHVPSRLLPTRGMIGPALETTTPTLPPRRPPTTASWTPPTTPPLTWVSIISTRPPPPRPLPRRPSKAGLLLATRRRLVRQPPRLPRPRRLRAEEAGPRSTPSPLRSPGRPCSLRPSRRRQTAAGRSSQATSLRTWDSPLLRSTARARTAAHRRAAARLPCRLGMGTARILATEQRGHREVMALGVRRWLRPARWAARCRPPEATRSTPRSEARRRPPAWA